MSLIQLKNIHLLFGNPPLLDGVDLVVHARERVCIVGRNGCGKSTLLKILSGDIIADDGQRLVDSATVIARLEQDPPETTDIRLFDYVAEGLADLGEILTEYHRLTLQMANDSSSVTLARVQQLQEILDARDAWRIEQQIRQVMSALQLDAEASLNTLSGGWRRKAALARTLVRSPDILLLDEPTNHLDIEMIQWLENSLLNFNGAIVFISHDRAFIRRMATRIVDVDRGKLTSYPGDYDKYLEKKQQDLEVEANHQAEFDKKLAQEEVWIRQGIKARRTRNEGRVRALKQLRQVRQQRRERMGSVLVSHHQAGRSGKRVFMLENLSVAFQDKVIIRDFSTQIMRGDKVALIGPNGIGKSTLIKVLLGQLVPSSGTFVAGANIEVAYFDQHRQALNLDETVIDAVAEGKRDLMVNGHPRHVMSYLQDYLFTPERANSPIRSLSGGERNRLLLARLMLKPSNVLILDEPTNDLDVETLEILEGLIAAYEGTVIIVSHDREFIDNVVDSSIFFEGNGVLTEFVGGYSDVDAWYQQQAKLSSQKSKSEKPSVDSSKHQAPTTAKGKKLSYKEQRELDALPQQIESLEGLLADLQAQVNSPDFFRQDSDRTAAVLARLQQIETDLNDKYIRWDALEAQQKEG